MISQFHKLYQEVIIGSAWQLLMEDATGKSYITAANLWST